MSYEEFDNIITKINVLEDKELDEYIDKKIKHLEEITEIDEIGIIHVDNKKNNETEYNFKYNASCCFIHNGYFSLNSRIYDSPNFYNQDNEFYNLPGSNSLIVDTNDYIKEFCYYIKDKEVLDIETLFIELSNYINNIFLNNKSNIIYPEENNIIYKEKNENGEYENSYVEVMSKLSTYRGTTQQSKCKINSIIANNILNFFGIPFSICLGVYKDQYPIKINDETKITELDGEHAFNILFGNNTCYLYDSTKTAYYMTEDKKEIEETPFFGTIDFHSTKGKGKNALDTYFSEEEDFLITPIYCRPIYRIKDENIEILDYGDSYFVYSIGNNNDFSSIKPHELFKDCNEKALYPENPFNLENNLYEIKDNRERVIELIGEKIKEEESKEENKPLIYIKLD